MNNIITYGIVFVILLVLELVYFKIADKFNIIDKPNERSSHSTIVLRGGGIIFLLGAWVWSIAFGFQYPWFLLGLTLVAGVSFIDDIHSLPDSVRLVVQFTAAAVAFYQLGMLSGEWFETNGVLVGGLLILLALIVYVGATNVINFMDGINGITAGYALAVLLPLLLLNTSTGLSTSCGDFETKTHSTSLRAGAKTPEAAYFETKTIKTPEVSESVSATECSNAFGTSATEASSASNADLGNPSGKKQAKHLSCEEQKSSCNGSKNGFCLNKKGGFVDQSLVIVSILSVLVFCIFNFRPKGKAKCFAGDVGSIGIAFIMLFLIGKVIIATGDLTYLVFLLVYGVDGVLTICHRIMLHENLGEAHRKHAYQLMANELKIGHVTVSLIYMALQMAVSLGFIYLCPDTTVAHWVYLVVALIVLAIAYILFKKKYYHLHEEYLASLKQK